MTGQRLSVSQSALPALPVRPSTSRRQLCVRAAAQSQRSEVAAVKPLAVAGLVATTMAAAPAAQAAMEVMAVAEGEPFIVNVGWAVLCASFTFSLSLVVWGRSGL
ncbi:hypothetical protein WJX74_001149 [Apatococcus lobatus]|uniref:Cytochrome b6-f complex subunit PetN n=1 Tax=Apatococcus lobatus TaxID=904363 RepID=A0AAW1S287_9CHLO